MKTKRPFLIGLTGSIGMGKSTTAQMFADEGIAIWDADAAVHRLYDSGGLAVEAIRNLRSEAVEKGRVNRGLLREWITRDDTALSQIEAVVHPLVAMDREEFISNADADIVVLDIPLLFENNSAAQMDMTVVVTAPFETQRARVLARPEMTEERFQIILDRQMPDGEKRAKADKIIQTLTLEGTRAQVQELVKQIRKQLADA